MSETTPTAARPRFPSVYGISHEEEGSLDWGWAVERLQASRNYWICTVRPDGSPHAAPVWGLWRDEGVVFSTHPDSRKGRNLALDTRIAIHLESGDEVVILEGRVEPIRLDEATADAYGDKYGYRPDPSTRTEGWYRLRPAVAYAWLEQEYPKTATRFTFS